MYKLITVFVFSVIYCVNASAIAETRSYAQGSHNRHNLFGDWMFSKIEFPPMPQFPPMPPMPQIVFPEMPRFTFPPMPTIRPITPEEIVNMKPAPGSFVSGMSEVMTSQMENVDGKSVMKTKGTFIKNENGKISKTTFGF